MGKHSLEHQVTQTLNGRMALGQSRHEAKAELRATRGEDYRVTDSTYSIHSIKTREAYEARCLDFVKYVREVEHVSKYTSLSKCERFIEPYLRREESRTYKSGGEDKSLSIYTLKQERAALGMLYGHAVDYKFDRDPAERHIITHSRNEAVRDRHFSEERNSDLVTLCKATGGRRADIANLTASDVREARSGGLVVNFKESKGGRDRWAPVREEYTSAVRDIVERRAGDGKTPLFDKIHGSADIHSYRREYAQGLYKDLANRPEYLKQELKRYPPRHEFKNGREVKSDCYRSRDGRVYNRDALYVVSQALGHNRLDVVVNHYM